MIIYHSVHQTYIGHYLTGVTFSALNRYLGRYLLSAKFSEKIDCTLFFRTWSFTLTWFHIFWLREFIALESCNPLKSIVVQFINRLCCEYCSHIRREGVSVISLLLFSFKSIHYCLLYENGVCCLVAQSCPTLCDSMDCSTPGSRVVHYLLEFA